MSASADLHELVHTTALVLRRGLGVATLGVIIVLLGGGAIVGLAAAICSLAGDSVLVLGALAAVGTVVLAQGVAFAGFSLALGGETRLRSVIARAFARWPVISAAVVFGMLPLPLLAAGFGLLGKAVLDPADVMAPLAVPFGLSLLGLASWMLGALVLLPAAALMTDGRPREVPGHNAVVLAVGATPVVLIGTLLGGLVLPMITLPDPVRGAILGVALFAIGLATSALAVAGYAVATAKRPLPEH